MYTQVSDSGPHGPVVYQWSRPFLSIGWDHFCFRGFLGCFHLFCILHRNYCKRTALVLIRCCFCGVCMGVHCLHNTSKRISGLKRFKTYLCIYLPKDNNRIRSVCKKIIFVDTCCFEERSEKKSHKTKINGQYWVYVNSSRLYLMQSWILICYSLHTFVLRMCLHMLKIFNSKCN